MKSLKKLLVMAFMAVVVCFAFSGCTYQKDVGVVSISLNSELAVVEIYEGEFNEAGIKATVVYEDETSEVITITDAMVDGKTVSGQLWYKVPGTYAITVLFKNQSLDLTVKVLEKLVTVKFFDGYGNLIKEQKIAKGEDAVAPNDGFDIPGMQFIGWDRTFTNLTEDTNVYAIYASIETFDAETKLQGWQYRVKYTGSSNEAMYEFYKFEDGKVYYYDGKLESFLYSEMAATQGVDYTAVYSSRANDENSGTWKVTFYVGSVAYNVYYDGERLFTKNTDSNYTYYQTLNTKYALQNASWYKWTITEESSSEQGVNGYIRISSNAKMEFYRGASAPVDSSNVTILSYTMAVNDEGNIIILTEESSMVQALNIVCAANPYISNIDRNISLVG